MIGAIAGDIIGSVYEQRPMKTKDFPLFTVFLARTGHNKETIRARIKTCFGYDLDRTVDDIRKMELHFLKSCLRINFGD